MKTNEELLELIEKYLSDGLSELWINLEPYERRKVFSNLIIEYVESNF